MSRTATATPYGNETPLTAGINALLDAIAAGGGGGGGGGDTFGSSAPATIDSGTGATTPCPLSTTW